MTREFGGSEEEGATLEAPLLELDSTLNIFALANGLDLVKNEGAIPDRVFGWYRDGMERRMGLRMEAPRKVTLWVEARKKRDGIPHRAVRTLRDRVEADALREEIRAALAEGIERGNGITEDELTPHREGGQTAPGAGT